MWSLVKLALLSLLSTANAESNGAEVDIVKRGIQWPDKVLAPYIMLMKYPTFDVIDAIQSTGVKLYTLAFILSDSSGNPSWSGVDSIWDSFYIDYINSIRSYGGDVIISFGGAGGSELALKTWDVNALAMKYQQVIDLYSLTYIDIDIEGSAVSDYASVDRRNQAVKILKQNNPKLKVSYTLPATTSGLDWNGNNVLVSAVKFGLNLDVVNLMTMDYGNVANGNSAMGAYAISAAEGAYQQLLNSQMSGCKIGLTPMIGVNDVSNEIFQLDDAAQINEWAKNTEWVRYLGFWSMNRDTNVWNDLYLSSQIIQNKYDFINSLKDWANGPSVAVTAAIASVSAPVVKQALTNVPTRLFAPYCDILSWPTFDVNAAFSASGQNWFILSSISSDKNGDPAWGGLVSISENFYLSNINQLRKSGGDVIISFAGGANDLAGKSNDAISLQKKYQTVIDIYQPKWVDFNLDLNSMSTLSTDLRSVAVAGLQNANPGMMIQFTLPVTLAGLSSQSIFVVQSAKNAGLRIDVLNIKANNFGSSAGNSIAQSAIAVVELTYTQILAVGIENCKLGITVMIGQNNDGTIFSMQNAQDVAYYANQQQDKIYFVSIININRDNGDMGGLVTSSQVTQNIYAFTNKLKNWVTMAVPPPPPILINKPIVQVISTTSTTFSTNRVIATTTTATRVAIATVESLPSRIFAPYCDVLLWPTFDVSNVMRVTGTKWFTLAFVTSDGSGNPAWGASVQITTLYYLDFVKKLRALGGDVIVSFGGAVGQELATVVTDVTLLKNKYQSVVEMYSLRYIDFDIEGGALSDTLANDRRSKAVAALKQSNPRLRTSVTLPVWPSGLTDSGISLLKSAATNGWQIDVINIMAMDYGSSVAPDGANSMGKYAIDAARNTRDQAIAAGLTNFKIGITPMIGKNDVAGEVFSQANAQELLAFSQATEWIGLLSYWSINRDTNVNGPLYASSQITQKLYEFSTIFNNFTGSVAVPTNQSIAMIASKPIPIAYPLTVGKKIFAPYCDVMLWPTFDISAVMTSINAPWFTLAFVTADYAGNPAWGSITPISQKFYIEQITRLRSLGGDVIVSFGGATGQELAIVTLDQAQLLKQYQSVIDTYQFKWVDFDIEGSAISNVAANDRRAKVFLKLKANNPGLIISVTLPVMPDGLTLEGVNFIKNLVANNVNIDVVNLMTMDYGLTAKTMGTFAISAAKATYNQIQSAGLLSAKIGITPMIGKNDVAGEVFSIEDANSVLQFAQQTDWVSFVSYWSINRDSNVFGPLYASSQITQNTYDFAKVFRAIIDQPPAITSQTTANVFTTQTSMAALPTNGLVRPTPIARPENFVGGYNWATKIFAPYTDISAQPLMNIVNTSNSVGTTHYMLGFITAGANGKPYWSGTKSISTLYNLDKIFALRLFGGEVIISFGGGAGPELASVSSTPMVLRNQYQNVIDAYSVNWIDFNLDSVSLNDTAAVNRRNQALRSMQFANPNIRVTYSLPVTTTGFTDASKAVLLSCLNYGVRIDTFDFSQADAPNGATASAGYAIQAAEAAHLQVQSMGMVTRIGITTKIGQNNVLTQFFMPTDASQIVNWAKSRAWVGLLSFWSANRDNSRKSSNLTISSGITQSDLQFSKIFVQYEN